MTIVQFQYVLAVARYKNFTTAAEKSNVTQPTLSLQIQKLEAEFDVEIFDRKTYPIKPTKIGELIINQIKKSLVEFDKIKLLIEEEKGEIIGDYRIGIIPTILPNLAPLFLKSFHKKYPKSNLIVKEIKTQDIISQLKDNSIDFGIAVTPLVEEDIVENVLYYEPMVAYIPKKHKLFNNQSIKEEELDLSDLLLLEEGNCFRNNVLNLCNKNFSSNQFHIQTSHFNTLVKMADDEYGMTILPALYCDDLPEHKKKNIRNFQPPEPTRQVSLIHLNTQYKQKFKAELIQMIQKNLKDKLLFSSHHVSLPTINFNKL